MPRLIYLLLIVFGISWHSNAQYDKNNIKLSASALPLFGSSGSFNGINGIVVKPAVGFLVSSKFSVDVNFSYASLGDLKVNNVDSFYRSYAFVPSARYHVINNSNWRIFGEIGFGLGTVKYEPDDKNEDSSIHQEISGGISVFSLGVGVNYFFSQKFGIELVLPYLNSNNITSNTTNNIYSGFGPTIGVVFVLN